MKKQHKYLKTYENYVDGIDNNDLFKEFYNDNPLSSTHTLYGFVYKNDGFKEVEGGLYKKVLEIEKMHKILPDNIMDLSGMATRAKFTGQKLGSIWWPNSATEIIDGKGTDELDDGILDIIEEFINKDKSPDTKEKVEEIINRIRDLEKFNI